MIKAILICLLAINVVTFFVYGIDKYKAKHSKWRISEATLLLLAVIGGSIGAWCGMKVRHESAAPQDDAQEIQVRHAYYIPPATRPYHMDNLQDGTNSYANINGHEASQTDG